MTNFLESMNPLSLLPDSESEIGLFYLVPFSQFYLYHFSDKHLHLYLGIIGFLATVSFHTLLRAVYGPGLDDSLDTERAKKRMMTAVYLDRNPRKQPDTYGELFDDINFSTKLVAHILICCTMIFAFFAVQIYSISIYLYTFQSLDLIGQLTALGLIFPFIEGILAHTWISAYEYKDEIPVADDHTRQAVHGFIKTSFEKGMETRKVEYELSDGGEFNIEYRTEGSTEQELEEEIHKIAFGYVGLAERLSYPVSGLDANFQTVDGKEGKFCVKKNWAKKFKSGTISRTSYLEKVDATIQLLDEQAPNKGDSCKSPSLQSE